MKTQENFRISAWRQLLFSAVLAGGLTLAAFGALGVFAPAALADEEKMGHMEKGAMAGPAGCERNVHLTAQAENQMGGAHYTGAMPVKGSMKMGGMNTGGQKGGAAMAGMKTGSGGKGMEMAHSDHDAKRGGVLFMAPNEMHHVEGTYSPECGFHLYLYNAFTKPISVGRFHAAIHVVGAMKGEEAESFRFLEPNQAGSALEAAPLKGMKGPLQIELFVQFPGEEKAELFNFEVDETGHIS